LTKRSLCRRAALLAPTPRQRATFRQALPPPRYIQRSLGTTEASSENGVFNAAASLEREARTSNEAKRRGIKGRSRMNKAQLQRAVAAKRR
jgi:hypothetical protein